MAAGETMNVDIKDNTLPEVTAKVGDTIVWTNQDDVPHSVVLDDNSVTSENFNKGETFEQAFDEAGTFPYHCGVHPSMKASITISN
jgi:plastocyanin